MYNFNEFLMIEKVSNKEIKSVLNDPNIMVGIEFEMVLDDLDEYGREDGYDGTSWSELDGMYNEYMSDIRKYIEEIKETHKEWQEYIVQEGKDYIKVQEVDFIQKWEKEIKKLEGLLDNFATTNKEELQEKIDDLEANIDASKESIEEMQGLIHGDEYQEIWDMLEELADDVPEEKFEYVNNNLSSPPTTYSELDSFYSDRLGIYSIEVDSDTWIEVMDDPEYYDYQHVQDTLEYYRPSDYVEDDYYGDESSVNALENYPYWDELPFTNYDIGDYHSNSANSTNWRIETDGSLNSGGVEIISPAMPLQKMLKILPKMFAFIKKYGGTDSSTGMHVNMSYRGKNFETDADMLKLMLFVDEGFVWKHFPERVNNGYASSVLQKVIKNIQQNRETISTDFQKAEKKTLALFKKNIRGPEAKMFGVNTSNAGASGGASRIEFRYLGGSNYHKKLKEITSAIGRFGFYMSISMNEKMRKREYILKLNRLHQKFAKAENKNEIKDFDFIMKIGKQGKMIKKTPEETIWLYKRKKYRFTIDGSSRRMFRL